jgi:hypothetical protein
MKPGPDRIVACPSCEGLAKYRTLLSGNTFGARVWTDGRQRAPMLPQPPKVVRCSHCSSLYWLSEARNVGQVEPTRGALLAASPEWRSAVYVQEPEELDYYQGIRANLARNPDQERTLRILAWWRSNDAFRHANRLIPPGRVAATTARRNLSEWDENLRALLFLLDESNENDLVMKAEVYRELRMWHEAEAVLSRVRSADLSAVVSQIRALCESQDAMVRVVELEPTRIPEPIFLEHELPAVCPYCQTSSVQYRQLSSGRLICQACLRIPQGCA